MIADNEQVRNTQTDNVRLNASQGEKMQAVNRGKTQQDYSDLFKYLIYIFLGSN